VTLQTIKDFFIKPRGKTGEILAEQLETTMQIEDLEKFISQADFAKIRAGARKLNGANGRQ